MRDESSYDQRLEESEMVVFITGAYKGIGKAVAELYVQNGYTVVASDKELSTDCFYVKDARQELYKVKMDVADSSEISRVVEFVEKEIGPIDILIHVAGVFQLKFVEKISLEDWNHMFQINATGVFQVTQAVSEKMKNRMKGSIVVVSSNASKYPRMGMAAYAASKAAASMYTKCLALELSKYQIRCNIISPGSTDTDMQRQLWNGAETVPESVLKGSLDTYRLGIPLHKIAKPEEIAEVIYFLASEKAGHITMEEVTVDGGATMGV